MSGPESTEPRPFDSLADAATLPPSEPPPDLGAVTLPAATPAPAPTSDGVAVPGYEILGELGRGGMGVVYKARQTKLQRVVALKMILAGGHAGPAELARFRTEAESVARLQHPGIVQIYEVGEHAGLPYFSLEFVDGGSLEKRLDGTPLPPKEAAHLVEPLAQAMHYAHERGVVHRDLKPANVLLGIADCRLQIADLPGGAPPLGQAAVQSAICNLQSAICKIADFGLAKKLDDASGQTQSGAIMGTPSYMAPEQAGGRTREIGPATDVYALGAVLYECLTGRPPFRAATPLDTIMQVVSEEAVPPSRLVPTVPRDLETICLKCLQKDPRQRYASAAALGDDLRRFLDGRPVAARPVGRVEHAWRWCRRNRALAAALVMFALVLVGGTVTSTVLGLLARNAAERVDAEATAARDAEEKQRQLSEASHLQTVLLVLANGQRAIAEGDPATALPWYVRAAELDPAREADHLARIDAVLAGLPRATVLWRHPGSVRHLALSPDGGRAAIGGADGTAEIRDLNSGAAIGKQLTHGGTVWSAAFSPDGRQVATASGTYLFGGELRLWDAATGELLGQPLRLVGTPIHVGFTRDGRHLLSADYSALPARPTEGVVTSRAFALPDRKEVAVVSCRLWGEPTAATIAPRFHAGRGWILKVEETNGKARATAFDLITGMAVGPPVQHEYPIWYACFGADGARSLSIDTQGTGIVRDHVTGKEWRLDIAYFWRPVAAALGENDEVAVAFYDGFVQRYRISDGRPVQQSGEKLGSPGGGSAFSDDGQFLLRTDERGIARVWEVHDRVPVAVPLHQGAAVTATAFLDDGRRVLLAADNGTVRAWDLSRVERPWATWHNGTFGVGALAFDREGRCLLAGHGAARLLVRDESAWTATAPTAADATALATVPSPNADRIAVGTSRGELRLLEAATGQAVLPPLRQERPAVISAAFSRDGRRLAVTSASSAGEMDRFLGVTQVWDLTTGSKVGPLVQPGGAGGEGLLGVFRGRGLAGVTCAALSPDGEWLAVGVGTADAGGIRGEVQLFRLADGANAIRTLVPPARRVPTAVGFGPDGRFLAATSQPLPGNHGEVTVWDRETGQSHLPAGLGGVSTSFRFLAGGQFVVAAGDTVEVWDLESHRPRHRFPHGTPIRSLVHDERLPHLLVTATEKDCHLWDLTLGVPVRAPLRHSAMVTAVAASPDGRFLLTADIGSQVRAWHLRPDPVPLEPRRRLASLTSGVRVEDTAAWPVGAVGLVREWEELHARYPGALRVRPDMAAEWHHRQADRLAAIGVYASGSRHAARVPLTEQDDPWHVYRFGSYALAAGDQAALRQRGELLLRQAEQLENIYRADWVVKLSLLVPGAFPDPKRTLAQLGRLEKASPQHPDFPWFAITRALAAYRSDDLPKAEALLTKVREKPDPLPTRGATSALLLALVRQRQGQTEEARRLLAEAEGTMNRVWQNPRNYGTVVRIHAEVLLREARAALGAK